MEPDRKNNDIEQKDANLRSRHRRAAAIAYARKSADVAINY